MSLYSGSFIFGSQVRYINIDNFMNERLSFRTILTKMVFVTTSVASLMLDSIYFVLVLPLLSASFSLVIKLSQIYTNTYSSHDDFAWK
jgi:hypothetical protein